MSERDIAAEMEASRQEWDALPDDEKAAQLALTNEILDELIAEAAPR